ncbi:MAG: cbb3-type cytochrome c oxidase subunit II [Chthoniobacterales bacterium]
MKGLLPLILGVLGTFAFSWLGLTVIPNAQIGHLDPQMDEDGADAYPAPKSGLADRGRGVYVANGCVYCHSQQVRADYAGSDIERHWGDRRSAPRDYLFERPVLLGRSRLGPDLANIGKRSINEDTAEAAPVPAPAAAPVVASAPAPAGAATVPNSTSAAALANPPPPAAPSASPAPSVPAPVAVASVGASPAPLTGDAKNGEPALYSAAWHHRHLYDPRSISKYSNMPSYRFLYEKRKITGERSAEALPLTGPDAPPEGWEIIPTYEARCLVAYLMSLDQSHALNEVKTMAVAAAPAAAPGGAAK